MGEGGRVRGECLECPFHSWTFRGDGLCDNVPYSEKGIDECFINFYLFSQ